jgi:threonine/homoserine/homoserine lactone efflux protein
LSAPAVFGFAPIGFASALLVYGTYGLLLSSSPARRTYASFARAVEALFGFAFGAIGGKLAADGISELTSR